MVDLTATKVVNPSEAGRRDWGARAPTASGSATRLPRSTASPALLLGTAATLRGVADDGSPDVARIRAAAARQLGEPAFSRAYRRGAGQTRDAALAELRRELPGPAG